MGYAMPLMRRRGWRTSASSLTIGLIWAVWHYIPLLEAGRTPAWIAWWSLGTVAARAIIVWLYDNTGGSVLAAAVFHDMVNVTYSLFPANGSYYNPAVTGVIEAAIAVAIIITQEIRRRYPVFGRDRRALSLEPAVTGTTSASSAPDLRRA
jgi:uncharacterized protein